MSEKERAKQVFVEDDTSQRRRRLTVESESQIRQEIQLLKDRWSSEKLTSYIRQHPWRRRTYLEDKENRKDDISAWKREALEKTVKFPEPPASLTRVQYHSIFLPLRLNTETSNKVHIDDYARFHSSIQDAANYRLSARIEKLLTYPVRQPEFAPFPSGIIPLSPTRLELKWHNFFLFWELPERFKQKRRVEEFNRWLVQLQKDRQLYWETRNEQFDKACEIVMAEWKEAKSQWEREVHRDKARLEELRSQYESGGSNSVVGYFLAQLNSVPLPMWCPREYELQFHEDEGILLIEVKIPYFAGLEVIKTRQLKSGLVLVPANQREIQELTNQFPFLIVLRLMWEIPQEDWRNRVGMVCCNGYVLYDDPATGRPRRDVILSVVAKQEDLKDIRLERVEPEACFRSLRGVAAAKISELVPVQPLIRFNKQDNRFIAAREVLHTLGNTNLATMDWQDFEHLIRELFEREFGKGGAEVKITQASRDRGVDAVVFDPDPVRGGKFVIQAKRYTNTVDVSAVRDLYGTVVNEGANRGILVTTSNYGRDAYDFAKDKPITLIDGANLLHLLQKHGYFVKIDLKEAKRLLRDSTDA